MDKPEKPYELFFTSKDCINTLKQKILEAKSSIDIEIFYFIADNIGLEIINILKEKSRQAVKIRLLFDHLGSFGLSNNFEILKDLKRHNIQVLFFNSTFPFTKNRKTFWFLRDHRRTVLIDNEYLFTGSFCIGQETSNWLECGILIKDSNLVSRVKIIFNETWNKVYRPTFKIGSVSPNDLLSLSDFNYITQAPLQFKRHIYKAYLKSIKTATRNIYLVAPYFVPNPKFIRQIIAASKKGIEVNIIIPKNTEFLTVDLARNTHINNLLKNGVNIYFYNKMLHSKFAVFDSKEAFIGTLNLDNLSLKYNYECAVKILNEQCILEINHHVINDLLPYSEKLDIQSWKNRDLFIKIMEKFVFIFRRFL